MLSAFLAASALNLLTPAAELDQPLVKRADIADEAKRQTPQRIVRQSNGKYWVLRQSQDSGGWPTLWVDRFDERGVKQWSYHHPINRNPAGVGFDYIGGASYVSGGLVFSFHSDLMYDNSYSHLAYLGWDGSLKWEVPVDHTARSIEFLWDSTDFVTVAGAYGDTFVTRRSSADGSEVWAKREDTTGTERYRMSTRDRDDNIIVVGAIADGNSIRNKPKLAKFSPSGQLLWSRTYALPSDWYMGGIATPVGVFATNDRGIIAVYRIASEKKLEIHRYAKSGALLKRHTVELGDYLGDGSKVIARKDNIDGREAIVVAWDTRSKAHLAGPEIGTLALQFYKTDKRVRTRSSGRMAKRAGGGSGIRQTKIASSWAWDVRKLADHRLTGTGELLEGMDVGYRDRIYLATTKVAATDRIRVSVLPRNNAQSRKYLTWDAKGRQVRPVDLLCGRFDVLHVLGKVDDLKGANTSTDADQVIVQVFMNPPASAGKFGKPTITKPGVTKSGTNNKAMTKVGD